jgi:hypothetical protein
MKITIKKSDNLEKINEKLSSLSNTKGFDAHKFCGVLKLKKTPLQIQKQMRDEWE